MKKAIVLHNVYNAMTSFRKIYFAKLIKIFCIMLTLVFKYGKIGR